MKSDAYKDTSHYIFNFQRINHIMIKLLKKIYSRPFLNESRSPPELILYRIFSKAIWIFYKIKYRKALLRTRKFIAKEREEITTNAKFAFVFANGPSVGDIDLDKISKLCNTGKYDLIALNSFLSSSASIAKPKFAIFADNIHFQNPSGQYKLDISRCHELGIRYFAPAKYYDSNNILMYSYCSLCNIDEKNVNDILKPAGYYGVTAFFALSLALMLGYERIYICGFDNSYFKDFEISQKGEMIIRHRHYYNSENEDVMVKCLYTSTSQFMFDVYRHFSFLEKIIGGKDRFKNLAKTTYLSCVRREFDLDVYK